MAKDIDTSHLSTIPLFQDLPAEALAHAKTHLRRKSFPAHSYIFDADQPGTVVYILTQGTVKIHVVQDDGSDVIICIVGAGEVLGELSALDGLGHSASVYTLEQSEALWMDQENFHKCLQSMPMLSYNLMNIMARRLRLASTRLQVLASLDVNGRVAHQLLSFAREYGEPLGDGSVVIPLQLTQSDLSDLIGASRVSVNQVIVAYKERHFISMDDSRRFVIHNQAALLRYCR